MFLDSHDFWNSGLYQSGKCPKTNPLTQITIPCTLDRSEGLRNRVPWSILPDRAYQRWLRNFQPLRCIYTG